MSISAKPIVRMGVVSTDETLPTETQRGLLALIRESARDPAIDVVKLRELLAMAREEEQRAAERAFNVAMLACQQKLPAVVKNAWNPHTKSRYAQLEAIQRKVDPIIHDHGFTQSFGMTDCPVENHYRIICDVSHIGGATRRWQADIGFATSGAKGGGVMSGAQGSGASISYGKRYLTTMIFNIPVTGEDTDGSINSDKISKVQAKEIEQKAVAAGITLEQFESAFGVKDWADLPSAKYQVALDRIAKRAAMGNAR